MSSVIRRMVFALALVTSVLLFLAACNDDDDDDQSVDDDVNDDATDDDIVQDDDTTDDDSLDEESAPAGLLVIGQDAEGWASWRKQPDEWRREEIPPPTASPYAVSLGPTFFLNGKKGWIAWNVWSVQQTLGYEMLAYDSQSGWAPDPYHQPPDNSRYNLNFIFASDEYNMWTIGNLWLLYYIDAYQLAHYVGDAPPEKLSLPNVDWLAMFFPDEKSGLVSASLAGLGLLARWDDGTWSNVPIPSIYRVGVLNWIWLEDAEHGWFIWEHEADYHRKLLRFDDGEWSEVTPPPGCEDSDPWRVYGSADYAITIDRLSPDDRFWEFRDGSWRCRRLTGAGTAAQQEAALVRRDGRVFVLAGDQNEGTSALFEVTADAVRRLGLPPDVRAGALHALGAEAPRFSVTK